MGTFIPWKILHVELSEGIPNLAAIPGCQGIQLIFWWRGIPLGHQEILAEQLPMPDTEVANRASQTITPVIGDQLWPKRPELPLPEYFNYPFQPVSPNLPSLLTLENPLELLSERWSNPVVEAKTVSLVICTRDRPEQLANCLRSLQNLSLSPHEIIVVDNAPTSSETRELTAQFPQVRYVLEPRSGLSVARNTGIRHSSGEIIAFTDDDVEVHPEWIARLQYCFDDPQVMVVTGLVLPAELATDSQLVFEKGLGGFSQGYRTLTFDLDFFNNMKKIGVPVWRIGAGANMTIRRQAFDLVGYFDERLGAGAAGCSEDSEFWYRILAGGWLCRYEPAPVVYHYHRGNLETLKRQMYQYMRGHVAALLVQFNRYRHWGNLYRILVSLPLYYTKLLFVGSLRGFKDRYSTVISEILGCLAGIIFYLKNPSV